MIYCMQGNENQKGIPLGGERMFQHDMTTTATRPSDLKLNNRMQILEMFKSGSVYSVADIASEIGISRQTVMKAIQFFLDKGIIVSDGKADSSSMGGKRAELFTLSAHRYLFNVLICPNGLYISLFNYRCEIIDDYTRQEIIEQDVDTLLDEVIAVCDRLLNQHNIERQHLRGVCLSTPGIVERNTQRLRFISLFPKWGKDIPITERLAAHFGSGVTILAENVSKVCGSAYLHDSRANHSRVAAVVSRWSGISACLMNNGQILYGKDELIGQIGHMFQNPCDTEVCGCGSRGCFERQVSIERLRLLASRWQEEEAASILSPETMTIQDIFEASRNGDPLGRRLSAYAACCFASALRNLTLVFNPDRVIFQGDYASADPCFRDELFEHLKTFQYYDYRDEHCPFPLDMDTRTIQEMTTQGAYTLLIDRLFSDETTYS